VDVNIRGMQGMNRVAVTVDGAENSLQVYQGYQGISNRTFLDPDLLAGVDITRGSDAASRGIAGTVAMRTLGADDIIKSGDTWGVRVKGGFGTNTATAKGGALGGYAWPVAANRDPVVVASPDGMDRPGFLTPTSGSGSIAAGVKQEGYDLFAGYAYRKQGNYFAGKHGPYANPQSMGPQTICSTASCQYWPEYFENTGIANYRAGEEVLNTQLQTQSWLTKATLRFDDEHSLQIGYSGFRSEAGDLMASALTSARGRQPVQQGLSTGVKLDSGTFRYRWEPADNDLIDLTSNLWLSHLRQRYAPRGWGNVKPESYGLPTDFRTGSDSLIWGGDVANRSKFDFDDYGMLDVTYGLSFISEETKPVQYSTLGPISSARGFRDIERQETGGYAKASYKPLDWLTFNAGLRYSHFWSHDRQTSTDWGDVSRKRNDGGFSPSFGITLEPLDGVQLYANYANALRLPSIVEAGGTYVEPNPDLRPERNSSWEIGTNLIKDSVLTDSDSAMLKLGYFNWDVKDYISRQTGTKNGALSLSMTNIDRAKFSGLELSGRYELDGFTAEVNANYYLDVVYCLTAGNCSNATLYSDYATNQVPPEYSVDLSLSQKLFDERLTLGGRVLHVGPRAAGHGQITMTGMMQFISVVSWKPYTLVDVFAEYKINDNLTAAFRVENLTDQYYVDPLSLVRQPGPGRTFYASLTGTFGGEQPLPLFSQPLIRNVSGHDIVDWSGGYAGFHLGRGAGNIWGNATKLDGVADSGAFAEAADVKLNNMLAGVQAGYNWQLSNGLVLGIEGDWSKTSLKGQQETWTTWEVDPDSHSQGHGIQANAHYNIDWTASLRGRLGYAFNNRWMVYGTGGIAFAKERQWRDQYTNHKYANSTDLSFVEMASAKRTGFILGGGAEYAISDRWSLKGEYAYSRFGNKDLKFSNARENTTADYITLEQVGTEWLTPSFPEEVCQIAPIACEPFESPVMAPVKHAGSESVGRKMSNSLDTHTFKIGLNYRF
jgi:hemoglobin/transferrin/lactoferrin receptor protein